MNQIFVMFGIHDKGVRPMPTDAVSAAAKIWTKENAKEMFLISSSVESAQLECFLTYTTAPEMWTKLSSIHEQKSETNKLILTQRFHQIGTSDGRAARGQSAKYGHTVT